MVIECVSVECGRMVDVEIVVSLSLESAYKALVLQSVLPLICLRTRDNIVSEIENS